MTASNPRQQHRFSHRLDQIVVGARAETEHHRAVAVSGGHDDHRHGRRTPKRAQHVQSVHVGQPQIQQHQIAALDAMEGVGAAAGSDDGRAGLAEKLGQRRRDPLVVLDKQHPHGADATKPSPKPARC